MCRSTDLSHGPGLCIGNLCRTQVSQAARLVDPFSGLGSRVCMHYGDPAQNLKADNKLGIFPSSLGFWINGGCWQFSQGLCVEVISMPHKTLNPAEPMASTSPSTASTSQDSRSSFLFTRQGAITLTSTCPPDRTAGLMLDQLL